MLIWSQDEPRSEPQQLDLFGQSQEETQGEETVADPQAELEAYARFCAHCQRCALRQSASQVVFGDGKAGAPLMLVGEGPGQQEDRQGLPFVGPAGQLLDRILEAAGWKRQEVYIANVVKCRPPGNRQPAPAEIAACWLHLERQIELVGPRAIVCLGAPAAQTFLGPELRITLHRGQWGQWRGLPLMPTFHPAALLRDPSKKGPVWQDFQEVTAWLRSRHPGASSGFSGEKRG